MYARVVTFRRSSTNVDEANRIARERVLALMHQQPGFRGTYVLTDRASGKQLGISFWDTADQARGTEAYNAVRDRTSQELRDAAPPVTEVFEVAIAELTDAAWTSSGAGSPATDH